MKNEDSPAFPIVHPDGKGVQYYGMTLRDYFAAKCDVEVYTPFRNLSASLGRNPTVGEQAEYIASVRYIEADAMIAERAK